MGPGFSTKAVQAGQSPEQWSNREVVPPISLATVYEQFQMGETYKRSNYLYARFGNPNRNALETAVAALENADHGEYMYVCFILMTEHLLSQRSLLDPRWQPLMPASLPF